MRAINEKKYSVLEIDTVNRQAQENPANLVTQSEAYYNSQVMRAAEMIKDAAGQYRFILLCGPSASGKTTTAHKLKHRLIAHGVGADVLSMDDFYRGMEYYPKMADGNPDMESVQALDMDLLNYCFDQLAQRGQAMFPLFDFATQKRTLEAQPISLPPGHVLIIEGIHALNPQVLAHVPPEQIYRIYVSVRTKFMSGADTVLVPKDIRLMRRMVRDSKFRNYPPIHTVRYWDHVVASEKINIDLYRDDVNLKMDNTIDYEVCVWHQILKDTLEHVDDDVYDQYPQLALIQKGLRLFCGVDQGLIPSNSLLWEFIGK